jgi:3-dehydroquinate synthase
VQAPVFGIKILAAQLPRLLRRLDPRPTSIFVLVDRKATEVSERSLRQGLDQAGIGFQILPWTATEGRKSLTELEKIGRRLVRLGADRNSLMIGLGGGLTTDMAGFVASVFMRGMRWAAVPTTLLGMADAAIGGKTAVNLPEGKNLLGTFHQPEFVLADVAMLRTLPTREWGCGLGEIVKSAMIASPALLRTIEQCPKAALRRPSKYSLQLARGAARVKCKIVEQDPLEAGVRKLLNLGHTFGHALETAAGPRRLAHGEAVALGLRCAMHMAVAEGLASTTYANRIFLALHRCGLPHHYPGKLPSVAELTRLIARDKKKAGTTVDVVLPIRPGHCRLESGQRPSELAQMIHQALASKS